MYQIKFKVLMNMIPLSMLSEVLRVSNWLLIQIMRLSDNSKK